MVVTCMQKFKTDVMQTKLYKSGAVGKNNNFPVTICTQNWAVRQVHVVADKLHGGLDTIRKPFIIVFWCQQYLLFFEALASLYWWSQRQEIVSLFMQGEAKRWKERGKQLFKENRFDLLVDCYSLAINYAPTSDRELLAQLLCNRSLVHIRNKTFKVALLDAERCVKIRPSWSKVRLWDNTDKLKFN